MGASFDRLPVEVRTIHDLHADAIARGEAAVDGPASFLGKLIGRIIGFPPPGRHDLQVAFAVGRDQEIWTRDFGGHVFRSELSAKGPHLIERFGCLRFRFDLSADDLGLGMEMRGWSAFGVPLPLALAPRTSASEWAQSGRFQFDVSIALPLFGRIVRYRGWLDPAMLGCL